MSTHQQKQRTPEESGAEAAPIAAEELEAERRRSGFGAEPTPPTTEGAEAERR